MTTPHDATTREPTYTKSPAETKAVNDDAITAARAEYDASEKAANSSFRQIAGFPLATEIDPATAEIPDPADTVTVTITGMNFTADSVVQVDGVDVDTTYVSASEITADIESPAEAGTQVVQVANGPRLSEELELEWTEALGG